MNPSHTLPRATAPAFRLPPPSTAVLALLPLCLLLAIGFAEWALMKLRRSFILHPSALILFFAFGVCGAAPACLGSVPSPGFLGDFPGGGFPLAAVTMEIWQIAAGVLGLVVLLIGYHFKIGDYIRQQAGTPERQSVSIDGQPIEFKGAARTVNHDDLDARLGGYATTSELHEAEQRLEGKMETNFRELDKKRSASIGNLHEHLTGTATKIHERIEAVSLAQRTDMDGKIDAVRREIHEMPTKLFAMLRDAANFGGGKKR